jgi:hypothetical protein
MAGERIFLAAGFSISAIAGWVGRFTGQEGQKKRGARRIHKHLSDNSINLFRTSLDHLLLDTECR